MRNAVDFFAFATERERIRIKKESGEPWPWTTDPVLQRGFFCNVFREDDKVTRWFRENIRDHVRGPAAVMACCAFRWFNRISSGEILKPFLLGQERWDYVTIAERLKAQKKVLGGAYLILSPAGMSKVDGLLWCIRHVQDRAESFSRINRSIQEMHSALMELPFVGPFMAYEFATDLTHTDVLRDAQDKMSWACPGPGCTHGLGRVVADDRKHFSYKSRTARKIELMQNLLLMSRQRALWPWPEKPWTMREVEHVLCEYHKYKTAQYGDRLKRNYKP